MIFLKERTRKEITVIWLVILAFALYLYFFQSQFILIQVNKIADLPLVWLCIIYLFFGCIRGLTLIPVTYIILLGFLFLPPLILYVLTMIGVMISSACIYYFSEYLSLAEYFKKNHANGIEKLTSILQKNELPIVISWSFFPFTPTDLMCYVCGSLKIDVRKFLIGVFIGESISCAIYIFIGKDILLSITHIIF